MTTSLKCAQLKILRSVERNIKHFVNKFVKISRVPLLSLSPVSKTINYITMLNAASSKFFFIIKTFCFASFGNLHFFLIDMKLWAI